MNRENLTEIFKKHGFTDFKWLSPKELVLAHWVRMKCMFGCPNYGKKPCCPPQVPPFEECEKFFKEYDEMVIFHLEKQFDNPDERHQWTKQLHLDLLKVEREVFLSGHKKTFLICLDSCKLCPKCTEDRAKCTNPKLVRPTPEALGIDVFSTVKKVGYPIEVLKNYTDTMNRYAFLLIE